MQLGGQILQERPAAKKKRETMVIEGKVNGNPRKNREKTISDEINEEND